MNKRILSLCLALALLLCLLPAAPTAAAAGYVAINATNFPDANFRSYVSENCDTNGDGVLSPTEISDVTEILCAQCGIASLKGIEFFTALETLKCYWNGLTSLDVSRNTALEYLDCNRNQLTSLDVSKNTALEWMDCGRNQLTSLDVSRNTALEFLYCSGDQLTSLDVSKNTALTELSCAFNQLTSLDVSGCTALESLGCSYNQLTSLDVSKNTALTELFCAFNQLTSLDVSKNTALKVLECRGNQLTSLNVSGCSALDELWCSENQLTSLDLSKNTALKKLDCSDNQLTALDVSKNTALETLYCSDNQLTSLDVSRNTALETLSCDNNQLKSLDVSKNTALKELWCSGNQLTSLDVSKNTALEYLICSYNQLTSLDVSKNTALKCLDCYGNALRVLDVSAVPNLLDALKNGEKTVEDEFVEYRSAQGCIRVNHGQKIISAPPADPTPAAVNEAKNGVLQVNLVYRDDSGNETKINSGSGFLINEKNVVTCAHVVNINDLTDEDCQAIIDILGLNESVAKFRSKLGYSVTITRDVTVKATIETMSSYMDFAILTLAKNINLTPLPLRQVIKGDNPVQQNETVYAIGFPYESSQVAAGTTYNSEDATITQGKVNKIALGKNLYSHKDTYYLQTSCKLTAGNSGGPMVDKNGAVIGICQGATANSISDDFYYAIVIDQVIDVCDKLGIAYTPAYGGAPATNPFVDVAAKDYYYTPVLWAYGTGVTAGTNKTHFSPNDTCTRGQVVTFLWRAAGSPEPKTANNPFQDVRQKDYFYKAVLWAVENGVTSGTSKTRFSPNESCTRAQVVTFLWRYEKRKAPKSAANPFKDVKGNAYYYKAVLWAVENGVTSGTSKTKFSPDDTCTRGQIVTFLYRDLAGK